MREAERLAILAALLKADGRKNYAAKLLGVHRNTLAKKMKEMNIKENYWNSF